MLFIYISIPEPEAGTPKLGLHFGSK